MTASSPVTVVCPGSLAAWLELAPDACATVEDAAVLAVVEEWDELTPDIAATAEILVTGVERQQLTATALAARLPALRWLHSLNAGIEELAMPEFVERDIIVTNGSGAYSPAIAEYVFAALVLLLRGLPPLLAAREHREWLPHVPGGEIGSRSVGIVGYGSIGREVARLSAAAGARVWALRRTPDAAPSEPAERIFGADGLRELLAASDCVVLSAALNRDSRHLLGPDELRSMRPGAVLVNVARGALVNEEALAEALTQGRLGGAVVDVTTVEPLEPDSPLWSVPNLWITPHMSGGTRESRRRAIEIFARNLARYAADDLDALENRVDLRRELQ